MFGYAVVQLDVTTESGKVTYADAEQDLLLSSDKITNAKELSKTQLRYLTRCAMDIADKEHEKEEFGWGSIDRILVLRENLMNNEDYGYFYIEKEDVDVQSG